MSDWREQAACRGKDPEGWFPMPGDANVIAAAKRVCAGCPVSIACLEAALHDGLDHGIFGGLTERERRKLRRPPLDQSRLDPSTVASLLRGDCPQVAATHAEKREAVRLLTPAHRPPNARLVSDQTGIPIVAVERYRRQLRQAKEEAA